jgi:hypothetical protein
MKKIRDIQQLVLLAKSTARLLVTHFNDEHDKDQEDEGGRTDYYLSREPYKALVEYKPHSSDILISSPHAGTALLLAVQGSQPAHPSQSASTQARSV